MAVVGFLRNATPDEVDLVVLSVPLAIARETAIAEVERSTELTVRNQAPRESGMTKALLKCIGVGEGLYRRLVVGGGDIDAIPTTVDVPLSGLSLSGFPID